MPSSTQPGIALITVVGGRGALSLLVFGRLTVVGVGIVAAWAVALCVLVVVSHH